MEAGWLHPAPVWSDARTFDGRPFCGCVDIVTSGDPCQGNSVAGKRLGQLDDRWLLDRAIDIFDQSGASTFFRENVPGNCDGQLAVAIPALERLGCRIACGIFSSAETGNTMRRERFFILAKRADIGHERGGSARRWGNGPEDGGRELAGMLGGGQPELEEFDGGAVGQRSAAFDRRHSVRCGAEMVQSESIGSRESGTEHAGEQGRSAAASASDELDRAECNGQSARRDNYTCDDGHQPDTASLELGRPSGTEPQGQQPGQHHARGRQVQSGHPVVSGRAILPPAVIPGPADNRGWIDVLDRWPELQPALSQEEAESHLRRGIDAMAHRVERLRATGNGVDPLVAAYAWLSLDARLAADRGRTADGNVLMNCATAWPTPQEAA
mgnify:CR=1 FL=1